MNCEHIRRYLVDVYALTSKHYVSIDTPFKAHCHVCSDIVEQTCPTCGGLGTIRRCDENGIEIGRRSCPGKTSYMEVSKQFHTVPCPFLPEESEWQNL